MSQQATTELTKLFARRAVENVSFKFSKVALAVMTVLRSKEYYQE